MPTETIPQFVDRLVAEGKLSASEAEKKISLLRRAPSTELQEDLMRDFDELPPRYNPAYAEASLDSASTDLRFDGRWQKWAAILAIQTTMQRRWMRCGSV